MYPRKHYPRPARLALWAMTEIAIIGSDIQEVIGSAIAILLLTNGRVPIWAGVLITAADSFAILLVERLGVRLLEAVFGGLIGVMAISFGVMYFWAAVPTGTVLEGQQCYLIIFPHHKSSAEDLAIFDHSPSAACCCEWFEASHKAANLCKT